MRFFLLGVPVLLFLGGLLMVALFFIVLLARNVTLSGLVVIGIGAAVLSVIGMPKAVAEFRKPQPVKDVTDL